jgi:NAD-reducing hydrogenase large subunit
MLNRMEGLIRSFDPCLSCSTHADGTMELVVDVLNPDGSLQEQITR